jgi:hydrogenase nickel incorporation protein HypA/HybF
VHELSIAMGIVEVVTEELAGRGGGRVRAVHLLLGPLSGVAKDALLFAYPLACEDSALDGSTLVIEEEPVSAFCGTCDEETTVASIQDLRCSRCGAAPSRIVRGRSIEVKAMEVEE